MSGNAEVWLKPEEALTSFVRPELSVLNFEDAAPKTTKKRYGFKLGNIGILIPEITLSEVMKLFQVYPVPHTQPWFKGLTNQRGNLVPVYDIALMLGLSDVPMKHENLLVLEKGAESIGLLIDNLPRQLDVQSWSTPEVTPQLPADLTEYITEVYSVDNVIWICIDHKGFFVSIKSKVSM